MLALPDLHAAQQYAARGPDGGLRRDCAAGHYVRDERTGEEHRVGNNHQYWWKNDYGGIDGLQHRRAAREQPQLAPLR